MWYIFIYIYCGNNLILNNAYLFLVDIDDEWDDAHLCRTVLTFFWSIYLYVILCVDKNKNVLYIQIVIIYISTMK